MSGSSLPVEPGLCGSCVNARPIVSGRGSSFLLCELSRVDSRFPRYPPLPVLSCPGYTPTSTSRRSRESGN